MDEGSLKSAYKPVLTLCLRSGGAFDATPWTPNVLGGHRTGPDSSKYSDSITYQVLLYEHYPETVPQRGAPDIKSASTLPIDFYLAVGEPVVQPATAQYG